MLFQLASLFIAIVAVLSVPKVTDVGIASEIHNAPQPPLNLRGGEPIGQPILSAQSAFLIDTASGRILHEKNADEGRPIASITKLMTALAVLEYIEHNSPQPSLNLREGAAEDFPPRVRGDRERGIDGWNQYITFQAQDRRNGGIPYLIPGEQITVRDAWRLMLIGSSNDAAAMLARITDNKSLALSGVTKLSFVDLMNEKARALGLKHTVFADPTGLHAGNVSTAREVSALTRFALAHPEIRDTLNVRQFKFSPQGKAQRTVRSTNWLVGASVAPGAAALGGKTGHIEASGYNFAFAQGNSDQELVGVVLGAESNEARFKEMREMMEWGFGN